MTRVPDPQGSDQQAWQEAVAEQAQAEFPQTTPPASPPAAPPAPSPTLISEMQRRGYDMTGYESDDALVDEMARSYERVLKAPTAEQLEQYQRSQPLLTDYAQHAPEFQKWREEQEKQQAPPPTESKWQSPQLSDNTANLMERGAITRAEDGSLGVLNPYTNKIETARDNPSYARELGEAESWLRWQQTAQRQLLSDPLAVMRDAGLHEEINTILTERDLGNTDALVEKISQRVLGQINQVSGRQTVDQFWSQNQADFFETDEQGQLKYAQQAGFDKPMPIPKDWGVKYQSVARELMDMGITDESTIHEKTLKFIGYQPGQRQEPIEDKQQKQDTFLGRVRQNNGQNRVFGTPEQPPQRVASAAARESAQDDMSDEEAWKLSEAEARQDI